MTSVFLGKAHGIILKLELSESIGETSWRQDVVFRKARLDGHAQLVSLVTAC